MPDTKPEPLLVSVSQAATMLSVTDRFIYELVADGTFTRHYIRAGSPRYRLSVAQIREYVERLTEEK